MTSTMIMEIIIASEIEVREMTIDIMEMAMGLLRRGKTKNIQKVFESLLTLPICICRERDRRHSRSRSRDGGYNDVNEDDSWNW